ncbi:MAG: hypothetical protein OXD01_02840 [Gammaproteobacteria bacterium]|nr:hypothetical protein [Gammaproteobacteria bacterium]
MDNAVEKSHLGLMSAVNKGNDFESVHNFLAIRGEIALAMMRREVSLLYLYESNREA